MTVKTDEGVINVRVGAIIIKDEKVLMVKSRENWYYSVGGRIQFGETAETAIVREVFEETGVNMPIDRLGFVNEAYFYDTLGGKKELLIYELCFYFYMKAPENFEPIKSDIEENETGEHLEWVPLDTDKEIYPIFFKTELKHPVKEVKYIVQDER